jgi:hypothetical protein
VFCSFNHSERRVQCRRQSCHSIPVFQCLQLSNCAQGEEELRHLEVNNRRNQLMLVNLSQLEPETVTYKNVGKAYVLAPKTDIISSYEESYAAGLAELKKRKADKEVVDKSVESCVAELREHLAANEALAHALLRQDQGM